MSDFSSIPGRTASSSPTDLEKFIDFELEKFVISACENPSAISAKSVFTCFKCNKCRSTGKMAICDSTLRTSLALPDFHLREFKSFFCKTV